MGGGNVVINAVWKLVVVAVYAGLYELTPLRLVAGWQRRGHARVSVDLFLHVGEEVDMPQGCSRWCVQAPSRLT
jgi:hypothetical protein